MRDLPFSAKSGTTPMKSRNGMVSPKYDVGWVWERLMSVLEKGKKMDDLSHSQHFIPHVQFPVCEIEGINHVAGTDPVLLGGPGRNRNTDTGIFNTNFYCLLSQGTNYRRSERNKS
jgi:hypothetical protein